LFPEFGDTNESGSAALKTVMKLPGQHGGELEPTGVPNTNGSTASVFKFNTIMLLVDGGVLPLVITAQYRYAAFTVPVAPVTLMFPVRRFRSATPPVA
jgi:hypothetical protein